MAEETIKETEAVNMSDVFLSITKTLVLFPLSPNHLLNMRFQLVHP